MEQKITQTKIYEDDEFLAFENPIDSSIKVYLKQENDFHNIFTKEILYLSNNKYQTNVLDLLYKLLKGVRNGR